MPYLPKSMLVLQSAIKPGRSVYDGVSRIAIRPEDAIHIPAQEDDPHRFVMDRLHNVNPEQAKESDIKYKELFFKTIDRICRKDNFQVNMINMFTPYEGKVISSQALLLRVAFSKDNDPERILGIPIGASETTSKKYPFVFNFIGDQQPLNKSIDRNKLVSPVYMLAHDLLEKMENKGIRPEKMQGFFQNFMRLASFADHDYFHGSTVPHMGKLPYNFEGNTKEPFYGAILEKHALAVHAMAIKEIFAERPKRKDLFLSYAQKSFSDILEMQNHFQNTAEDVPDQKDCRDMITALSEIHAHRIFRVLSPDDPDLDKHLSPDKPSFNELLEQIDIHVPLDRLDAESGYSRKMSNKEKLLLNLSTLDNNQRKLRPGIYRDIHDITTVDVTSSMDPHPRETYRLTEIIDDLYKAHQGQDAEEIYKGKFPTAKI